MLQVVQNYKSGKLMLEEVPVPSLKKVAFLFYSLFIGFVWHRIHGWASGLDEFSRKGRGAT